MCLKPWQFSYWDQNDPHYAYLSGVKPIPAAQFAQAQRAAERVISGSVPDPTGGATHYYATTMLKAPAWTAKAKQTLRLGYHVFFKDVP